MDMVLINQLRKANQIPFKVSRWLEGLTPIVVHEEFGTMYKGCIIAEDSFGKYAAIVGVTDQLLKLSGLDASGPPLRILKVERKIILFDRKQKNGCQETVTAHVNCLETM